MAKEQKNSACKQPLELQLASICIFKNIPLNVQLCGDGMGTSDQWHTHKDFAELIIITDGSTNNEISESRNIVMRPGDIVLMQPDSCHRFSGIRQLQYYNITFDFKLLNILPGLFSSLPNYKYLCSDYRDAPLLHLNEKELFIAVGILENMRQEQQIIAAGYEETVFADFCRLLVYILRHAATGKKKTYANSAALRINSIISYMEEHIDAHLTIADFSSRVNMSESSFRHRFREITDIAPMDYLIRLRLRRAALLLASSNHPITRIALESGFPDGNYFARKFKQYFKCTARDFRINTRSGKSDFHQQLEQLKLKNIE